MASLTVTVTLSQVAPLPSLSWLIEEHQIALPLGLQPPLDTPGHTAQLTLQHSSLYSTAHSTYSSLYSTNQSTPQLTLLHTAE